MQQANNLAWIKVNYSMSNTESFANLFESYDQQLKPHTIVQAMVVDINDQYVIINAGLKSEDTIPLTEFKDEEPLVGDYVDVYIESLENGFGQATLSREKARRAVVWSQLETAHESDEVVMGEIIEKVKGGFIVSLDGVNAFLPRSLVDVKPLHDANFLENKEIPFKIMKMDKKRNNIVVSRRAVLEGDNKANKVRLDELQEGQEITGIVKNITEYGAFIDLGGADGLLHITDMSWKRVKDPNDILTVGDEIKVVVLKFDREKDRVSLGMKQLGEDPWFNIARRYPVGTRLFGKVTNVMDYGCFVETEDGVEGLVHMSEMDWTNKNIHPNKVVKLGDEVEVMVLEIDEDRRRISLGIKQCKPNPWQEFADRHKEGEKVSGAIRSITDFGVFVGLDGGIDGLIHLSDISWTVSGEDAVREYKKGDEVDAVILSIDADRERISLGIKQLTEDPLQDYLKTVNADQPLTVTVVSVEPKRATVKLSDDVFGVLKASDYSLDKVEDLTTELKEGDEVQVKLLSAERKGQEVPVSHRATLKESVQALKNKDLGGKATLGDLLKEQMQSSDDEA